MLRPILTIPRTFEFLLEKQPGDVTRVLRRIQKQRHFHGLSGSKEPEVRQQYHRLPALGVKGCGWVHILHSFKLGLGISHDDPPPGT